MKRPAIEPTAHEIESEGLPSASGFDAEFRCIGKRGLCKELPTYEDTAVQSRGVRIHRALEESDLAELSDSDRKTAERVMYGEAKFVHEFDFEGADITYEHRMWDVDDMLNHTWSAKLDALHIQPDKRRALVPDYKSGWTLPPPIDVNWQMRSQAALVADAYDLDEVVTALIHPHHADSLYEVRVYTRADLDAILNTVRHNVKAIQMPEQPLTYGAIQCQWCEAKHVCDAYQEHQNSKAREIADYIEDGGYTSILRMTPAQRGEDIRQLKEMAKNCEFKVAQYVELAQQNPTAVNGYTLIRTSKRKFTNEAHAMELVREEFGADALYDAIHLSLADLEKAMSKKFGAKKAKDEVQRILSPVLKYEFSKYFFKESRSL